MGTWMNPILPSTMEEMDDFGDLYADVASNFRHVYGKKTVKGDFVHGVSSHCTGDETELNNEESILYGRIGGVDDFDGSCIGEEVPEALNVENDRNPIGKSEEKRACCDGMVSTEEILVAEPEVAELDANGDGRDMLNVKREEADVSTLSQYSDSEDDLHIVLNEDDVTHSQSVSIFASNCRGGVVSGEDDYDDLVILMGVETPDKDHKWVEEVRSPLQGSDGGSERGRVTKNGGSCGGSKQHQNSQYLQYKYVRQRAAGFANRHRAPQSQVGHGDTKSMSSISGTRVPSLSGTSSFDPSGREFSLPRYMTIFDVDIESFEKKPWRCPGVDITDFFNFGMNEESWKHYCISLAQYREQATMRTNIPVYESVRPAEMVPGSADSKAVQGEFNRLGREERIPSFVGASERNARWIKIPKGRAIQVEDGTGERLPSVDVRRPCVRDSTVVIQVILEEQVEASKDTCKESVGPGDDSILKEGPGKEASEMESELLGDSHVYRDLNPASPNAEYLKDGRPSSMPSFPACGKSKSSVVSSKRSGISHLERYSGGDCAHDDDCFNEHKLQNMSQSSGNHKQRDAPENPMEDDERKGDISHKTEHSLLQNESVFSDQTSDNARFGHLERRSGSENAVLVDIEKVAGPRERHYTSSLDKQDERPSSFQDHRRIELKNNTFGLESMKRGEYLKFHQENRKKSNGRSKTWSVAASKMPMEDGVMTFSRNNSKYDLSIRHEIIKENVDFHSFHERRNLANAEGSEASNKYRRRKCLERHTRDAYSDGSCSEKDSGENLDVGWRRNIFVRDYLTRETDAGRGGEKHREAWLLERGNEIVHGEDLFDDEAGDKSSVEYLSINYEKDRYEYLKHEKERWIRMGTSINDAVSRKNCKLEPVRERYKKCVPCTDRRMEMKVVKERRGHDMRCEMRKSLRGRDMVEATWMHPCKRDLYSIDAKQTYKTTRNKMISENPSAEDKHHIQRQKESARVCCRRADSRDLFYRKHQDEDLVFHKMKECYCLPKLESLSAANNCIDTREDSGFSYHSIFSEDTKKGWFLKNMYCTDDESSSEYWHQENQDDPDSYYFYRYSRFELNDMKQHGLNGRGASGNSTLWNDKSWLLYSSELDVGPQIHSFSDVCDGVKNYDSTPLSCRESLNFQRNSWEEKFPRRCSRMGGLQRVPSDIEQRTFRRSGELHTNGEISSRSSKVEDSSVNSKIEEMNMHDADDSCRHSNRMCLDKHPVKHHSEVKVSASTAVPAEEKHSKKEVIVEKKQVVRKVDAGSDIDPSSCRNEDMNRLHRGNMMEDNQSASVDGNRRILEMLAKMEKRKERFKEPIPPKKESDKNLNLVVNITMEHQEAESGEAKQRPTRKRRWCGS